MTVENCITESPEQIAGQRAREQLVDQAADRDDQRGEQQQLRIERLGSPPPGRRGLGVHVSHGWRR